MGLMTSQLLWALLFAALSLPAVYFVTMLVLSRRHHGYARVDPVHLRRIAVGLSVVVFFVVLLAERLR